jgi:hypothetical protein
MLDTLPSPALDEFLLSPVSTGISMSGISTADNGIFLSLDRVTTNDTFAGVAQLIGLKVFWTSNAANDA